MAGFVGEPQINVLPGVARVHDGRVRVEIGSNAGRLETAVTGVPVGARVTVGIRPPDCSITSTDGDCGIHSMVAYLGVTAPPERAHLFDSDSGERLR